MYIVTFYSFKGGVGRTLALANVGLELARTGRSVLLIDFDLEAPGIHTFNHLRPKEEHQRGLVDYISDYLNTKSAPDVRNYIYEALGIGQNNGNLWIMPAGKNSLDYSKKLSSINWENLYSERRGFLMFEDMKAQWKSSYRPDYVLIDSRTGHTDIGGICTRQLPNAVVILFFPNEQNLSGLKPIVDSIRADDKKREKTTILHFVMSNVPDLDDEDEILANLEIRFQKELEYDSLTSKIHRYDSLLLLQQSLFIVERPKSRLAREYKKLMSAITEENIEDREGVIQSLRRKRRSLILNEKLIEKQEERISEIVKHHAKDGELLSLLASELKSLGRSKESEILLERAINSGYRSPDALLNRADNLQRDGNIKEALCCIWELFNSQNLNSEQLSVGIDILRRIEPRKLLDVANTVAFKSLSPEKSLRISNELNWCIQGMQAKINLLLPHYKDKSLSVSISNRIKVEIILALIALGKFDDAMLFYGKGRLKPEDLQITECFNYAMAEWAFTKIPPKDMFSYVIDLDSSKGRLNNNANYQQCLSIALWATKETKEALKHLEKAVDIISELPSAEFSCWRYLTVSPKDFIEDCDSIKQLIQGKDIYPLFWQKQIK